MSVYALKRRRLLIYYLEITPFRKGNLLSELCLNVHSETHRFALGSQILIDCLLLDVIHKYRYSNHLDYNAYHTWLHMSHFKIILETHPLFVLYSNNIFDRDIYYIDISLGWYLQ